MRKTLIASAIAATLAACSTAPAPATSTTSAGGLQTALGKISTFTVKDLTAADADAVAHGDTVAHACYPALIQFVQSLTPSGAGTVAGAFSAFQKARDLGNSVVAGVPTYLQIGCAPLVVSTENLIAGLAAIGAAGAATSGAVLPVVLP